MGAEAVVLAAKERKGLDLVRGVGVGCGLGVGGALRKLIAMKLADGCCVCVANPPLPPASLAAAAGAAAGAAAAAAAASTRPTKEVVGPTLAAEPILAPEQPPGSSDSLAARTGLRTAATTLTVAGGARGASASPSGDLTSGDLTSGDLTSGDSTSGDLASGGVRYTTTPQRRSPWKKFTSAAQTWQCNKVAPCTYHARCTYYEYYYSCYCPDLAEPQRAPPARPWELEGGAALLPLSLDDGSLREGHGALVARLDHAPAAPCTDLGLVARELQLVHRGERLRARAYQFLCVIVRRREPARLPFPAAAEVLLHELPLHAALLRRYAQRRQRL